MASILMSQPAEITVVKVMSKFAERAVAALAVAFAKVALKVLEGELLLPAATPDPQTRLDAVNPAKAFAVAPALVTPAPPIEVVTLKVERVWSAFNEANATRANAVAPIRRTSCLRVVLKVPNTARFYLVFIGGGVVNG